MALISLFEDDASRWQAVVSRNSNADGFFVYGVKTTRIFCRPICKARLARRANVTFYATGQDAQRAGFRACKRCKPDVAGFMPEEAAVRKIREFVKDTTMAGGGGGGEGGEMRLSLSQMARRTGLSKWHFYRVFKKCVGVTPTEYLREQRGRERCGDEVPTGQMPVDQATWMEDLNMEGLDPGMDGLNIDPRLDDGFWDDALSALQQANAEGSSTATTENSPWSMDDFVVWPET